MVLCGMWVVFSYIVFTCILKVVSFNPIHSSHTHNHIHDNPSALNPLPSTNLLEYSH